MSRVFANTQAPVGGGLAARVVVQLTHVLTDAPSSLHGYLHNFGMALNLWRGSLLP